MFQRRSHGKAHDSRPPSHLRRPKSYKVMCSSCGKEVITPLLCR